MSAQAIAIHPGREIYTPAVHPQDLTDSWFVLRVETGHEMRVSDHLRAREIEQYTPSYVSHSNRRALFPGYSFIRFPWDARSWVLETSGVMAYLRFGPVPVVMDNEDVERIRLLEMTHQALPHPFVRVGDRIAIHRGPLAGVEGVVLRFEGALRIVVSVALLGSGVAATIEPWMLG